MNRPGSLYPDCGGTKRKTSEFFESSEVFNRGDDDLALAGALDGPPPAVFVDGEVNLGHFGKLLARKGEVV